MQRKLIPQGLGGYTIYLPKKWVDKKGLHKEDSVDILEVGPNLLVKAETTQTRAITFAIDKEDADWDLKVLLVHAYRKDFDRITLKSEAAMDIRHIESVVAESMLGFAITKKTNHEVEIENISEPSGEKYEAVLRRVFLINKETITTVKEGLEKGEEASVKVKELRGQLDKYVLFCKRILYKERYEHDPLLQWELLTFLMHINHTLFYFSQQLQERKIKADKQLAAHLGGLLEYYTLQYDAFYKKDLSLVKRINQERQKHHFGKLLKDLESSPKHAVPLSFLREAFRLVQIGTSPILAELIEQKLR